jgi:ADP-ribosylglycohydrolase
MQQDYRERVYAGVLGKIIGVYVGRPFEGWTYEEIIERIGEVEYYANDKVAEYNRRSLGSDYRPPLVVTDDDITGTFTFLRAIKDCAPGRRPSPEQIGRAWLNHIVENRSVFWWGGVGNSTEHTAYHRLKNGIPAPESGSIALNGKVVAEQIGSQIFIDGWAMVAPGDPETAADLARRAASVSHDGEAIYGAQVIAAMESAAFVESGVPALLDIGVSVIPADCAIRAVIDDVRSWRERYDDWRDTFAAIQKKYGYDKYYGNVHIIPNHAVVIMSLLYGADDFGRAMRIVNTAGWDTDCNSSNVGCLLGIRGGLACFEGGRDWRGPVADRLFMPTADGGASITDAVRISAEIVELADRLNGRGSGAADGGGAPFDFRFPGSIQGFRPLGASDAVANVESAWSASGRALRLSFAGEGAAATPVFILPSELDMAGYSFIASPQVYAGQTLVARVRSGRELEASLFVTAYTADGAVRKISGPARRLRPEAVEVLRLPLPDTAGQPVAEIGLEARCADAASVDLLSLTWEGEPDVVFRRPPAEGAAKDKGAWRRAWVNAVDLWDGQWREAFRLCQNAGRGLLIQGTQGWRNYAAEAELSITMAKSAGIAVRVQGLRRYYALLVRDGGAVELVKFDDVEEVLMRREFPPRLGPKVKLKLRAEGAVLKAWRDDEAIFEFSDAHRPISCGAAAFVVEEGQLMSDALAVRP